MGDVSNDLPQLKEIKDSAQYKIIYDEKSAEGYCHEITYLNRGSFLRICELYGYPITVICQPQYTDKMYRDAYYIYLSHLHFDIERHCQRLALFKGEIPLVDLFDPDRHEDLQKCLLGTMVIRPSYDHSTEYTLGRTLLDPYKLKRPLRYLSTARYKATILGQTYRIEAFPFSNQHGDVLRCAETSVWSLMEYYGTLYENYRVVLPSMISSWASKELPERSLPSEGLTYSQISSLLKTFDLEPRIYERGAYRDRAEKAEEGSREGTLADGGRVAPSGSEGGREQGEVKIGEDPPLIAELASRSEIEAERANQQIDAAIREVLQKSSEESKRIVKEKGALRRLSLHDLFHYYVESGIPLITAVCNQREEIYHSIVVIGHDERSPYRMKKESIKRKIFRYGTLNMIDSSSFYDRYITIDDNQYPYRSERFDRFSMAQNCKVEAFIVPLYKHILLDAETAVSIIETIYKDSVSVLQSSLEQLDEEENVGCQGDPLDNLVVLRYYLTTSSGFVAFRNQDTGYLEEKLFYSMTSFPKYIWVGEYSTLELYRQGKILGEIIVDATAPKYSGMGAVIAMRFGGRCASRRTNEPPGVLQEKLQAIQEQQARLVYKLYTDNLQKGDFIRW